VQIRIAERDGDAEKLAQLKAEQEERLAAATCPLFGRRRYTEGFQRRAENRLLGSKVVESDA
jgi:hypothetical protein